MSDSPPAEELFRIRRLLRTGSTCPLTRSHTHSHTHTPHYTHTHVVALVAHISLESLLALISILCPLYHVKKNGRDKVGSPVASIPRGLNFNFFFWTSTGRIGQQLSLLYGLVRP